jgi:hypothetical protein
MNSSSRSILSRSLMTGAASLVFMTIGAAEVCAQIVGADGENGADCFIDNCHGGNGGPGEPVIGSGLVIGGAAGNFEITGSAGLAGDGGDATAIGGSDETAIGGAGGKGIPEGPFIVNGGAGGNATATSSAAANGSGNAISAATATGGSAGGGFVANGNATAASSAITTGSGSAEASATATGGFGFSDYSTTSNATSYAETAKGGLAQAKAQKQGDFGLAQSTAKTTFRGVSVDVQSTDTTYLGVVAAIAQGGSGQSPVNSGQFNSFVSSTALPNTAYATTLLGSASNVADALLGPGDKIFGTAILKGNSSSTFDFSFRGDLLLGVIAGDFLEVVVNGADMLSEGVGDNTVINLGSIFGPNIDLTIEGEGTFAFGGAVPEPSTWVMMLFGFAGLGFAGHRASRRPAAAAA